MHTRPGFHSMFFEPSSGQIIRINTSSPVGGRTRRTRQRDNLCKTSI